MTRSLGLGLLLAACTAQPPALSEPAPTSAAAAIAAPSVMPARYLRTLEFNPEGYTSGHERANSELLLGDLLFHSPRTLGKRAQQLGISCNSCHPNGAAHIELLLGALSDRPGSVDLSSGFFRPQAEDGIDNALNVPSLRGCRYTAPYGRDGRVTALSEFVQGVVHREFDAEPLSPDSLAALVRYLHDLDFLPNRLLDAQNQLSDQASPAARRGALLFNEPRPGLAGKSCASCHPASSFFRDGLIHRLGSGHPPSPHALDGGYETPSLLGSIETPPYFHDGRFARIADVIDWFDTEFALALNSEQRADLTAYVEAIGAVDRPHDARPLARRLDQSFSFLALLPLAESGQNQAVLELVGAELARAPRALSARARANQLTLSRLQRLLGAGQRNEARDVAVALRTELARFAADWAGSDASKK
ncbi:MAG: hypothetical protein QM756_25050 [Polyangiaceae bacterium]